MDNPTMLEIRQTGFFAGAEGSVLRAPALKMGVPVSATIWDLLALQGRMFNMMENVLGTPLTGSAADAAAIVTTAPSLRFTVPTGYTVFPRRFQVNYEARAGTYNEVKVVVSETDTYTSGGVALTANNWRTDNPRASIVTNKFTGSGGAIVEAALVRPRTLYGWVMPAAVAAGENLQCDVTWDMLRPVVGPASFLVWISAVTTASTYLFSLDWAEVPTASVI
jgi:hypothetical protein